MRKARAQREPPARALCVCVFRAPPCAALCSAWWCACSRARARGFCICLWCRAFWGRARFFKAAQQKRTHTRTHAQRAGKRPKTKKVKMSKMSKNANRAVRARKNSPAAPETHVAAHTRPRAHAKTRRARAHTHGTHTQSTHGTHTHTFPPAHRPPRETNARATPKKTPRMIYWPLVTLFNVVSRVPILKRGVKTKHCFEATFPPRPVGAFGWKVVMLWSRSACAETKRAHSDPIRYHR
jgi:hypothetical protein